MRGYFTTKNPTTLETYKQKISHLKALYHLACADNELSEVELVYIKNVAQRLGVNAAELDKFDANEPDLELPNKEHKIYALFHRLVIIVMLDGTATEEEQHYCFNLGVKMGLHPNAIQEIIDYTIAHGSMGALPDKILSIFRKYKS